MTIQNTGYPTSTPALQPVGSVDAVPAYEPVTEPTAIAAAADRQPKGDHNRRLALGLDIDVFALEAGVTVDELREYEQTWPDHEFNLEVASRVGAALERLERNPPPTQKVSNGPVA